MTDRTSKNDLTLESQGGRKVVFELDEDGELVIGIDVGDNYDDVLLSVEGVQRLREWLGSSPETNGDRGIPHPSEGLSWEQFWQRVREINFNPSPGELRAALACYEDRECPYCLRQLEGDEIIGSCIHNGGQHRRTLKSPLREATDQFAKDVSNALKSGGES